MACNLLQRLLRASLRMTRMGNRRSQNDTNNGRPNRLRKRDRLKKVCKHFQRWKCRRIQYSVWKESLKHDVLSFGSRQDIHKNILRFWTGALEILESDNTGNHQLLAKDIVDSKLHGLQFVLLSTEAGNMGYDKPFLSVITHPSLLNCLSIDASVDTLYAYFGGTNGDRAFRYLISVCQGLMSKGEDNSQIEPAFSLDMIELLWNTLYQLLSRDRTAQFHDDLPAVLELTRKLGSELTEACLKSELDALGSRVDILRRIINHSCINVPLWGTHAHAVGAELVPCLPRRQDTPILCSEPDDIEMKSLEDECSFPCSLLLERCGHKCQAMCHSALMHDSFSCQKACPRIRSTCEHKCTGLCGEICGPCMMDVQNVKLPCGHIKETIKCYQKLDLEYLKCEIEIEKTIPKCGHISKAPCFQDVSSDTYHCPEPCNAVLPCGHNCTSPCDKCLTAVEDGGRVLNHPECRKKCNRPYGVCSHFCPRECHEGGESCAPCMVDVQNVKLPCGHIEKTMKCYQKLDLEYFICEIKVEKTNPNCGHTNKVPCFLDVSSETYHCPEPCNAILPCGHNCTSPCDKCLTAVEDGGRVLNHPKCRKKCNRSYGVCNHFCPKECHEGKGCGPCEAKCEVRCLHSTCDLMCGKPCAPCIEKCGWSCDHQGACSMPCAAPCDRLPCDERCTKILRCGHQCPSLCGEDCPENLCQECGDKGDSRVDFLEWKTYSEIDLKETPIIVLGCGHFFTMESVDGLVDLDAVYRRDEKGKFDALQDISSSLASAIPSCPDCRQPIRQFATKRYNRVVNRAIMDEIYRRFLTKGRVELESLQSRVNAIEDQSNSTSLESPEDGTEVYKACDELQKEALDLSKAMEAENPMKRLIDIIAIHKKTSMREIAASLSESKDMDSSERESHNQITLDARLIYVKVQEIRYSHVFKLINRPHGSEKTSTKRVERLTIAMGNVLEHCHELIAHAEGRRLYRIAITATISFAKISQLQGLCHRLHNRKAYRQSKDTEGAGKYVNCFEIARGLVAAALKLCGELGNCPELQEAVEEMARLYEGPRYEKITFEELQSIKTAMVSGREGMATHCGHWYNCANGHPFAIGECGMPMEQATCPECGAPIGGQDHRAVEGVSRARYME